MAWRALGAGRQAVWRDLGTHGVAELPLPEALRLVECAACQQLLLPERIVNELDLWLGRVGCGARTDCVGGGPELAGDQARRPAVCHHGMEGQEQDGTIRGKVQQGRAHERRLAGIDRLQRFGSGDLLGARRTFVGREE